VIGGGAYTDHSTTEITTWCGTVDGASSMRSALCWSSARAILSAPAQNSILTHHDYMHLARTVHPDNERRLYVA
jgi:hypothetical protein